MKKEKLLNSSQQKAALVVRFYFIFLVGSFIAIFLGELILEIISAIGIKMPKPMPTSEKTIMDWGAFWAFFGMVIWSPIVEELLFRYWLLYSRRKILISLCVFVSLIIVRLFSFSSYGLHIFYCSALFVFLYKLFIKIEFYIPPRINIKSNFLLILSAVTFSFFHLSNYNLGEYNWFLYTPYILPQLFSGLFFGYIRNKYGFFYCLIVHSMGNLTSFTVAYLF